MSHVTHGHERLDRIYRPDLFPPTLYRSQKNRAPLQQFASVREHVGFPKYPLLNDSSRIWAICKNEVWASEESERRRVPDACKRHQFYLSNDGGRAKRPLAADYLETSERLIIHSALVNEDEQIGVVEPGDL